MRIILIGFMSSGKTTIGKILANNLNYNFYDIDEIFEERFKISINNFFEKFGENKFRELEHYLLKKTLLEDNCVVSCGGGTPCFYDNIKLINESGMSIYLKLPQYDLLERLKKTKKKRPLIVDLSNEKLKEYIYENLNKREIYYNQARVIIDVKGILPQSFVVHLKELLEKQNLILPFKKE